MALTYTPELELGRPCPDFTLPSVDGKLFSRNYFAGSKALVVMFICNHCPYVQAIEGRLIGLAHELTPQGVAFVGICANDPSEYPEDRPEALFRRWREQHYAFPYLLDESQATAKAFGAVCTPDIFVYDSDHKLRYRGRLDDSWRNPKMVRKQELKEAILRVMQNLPIQGVQNSSMGCSIKWKKGD